MNTKALKAAMDWKETGIIAGVKVRQIPIEGNACYYGVGSDSYGYQIGKVSDDGTKFEVLREDGSLYGMAILATRKNFRARGRYFFADSQGKPSYYRSRGSICGSICVTNEAGCGTTYLDPSF